MMTWTRLSKAKARQYSPYRVAATLSFVIMIAAYILTDAFRLGGMTTLEVLDSYPNLFIPDHISLLICGLIYGGLFVYLVYQHGGLRSDTHRFRDVMFDRIAPYFCALCVLNVTWAAAWHMNHIGLSMIFCFGMLWNVFQIICMINTKQYTMHERVYVRAPFSMYAGWLTMAAIGNVVVWLVSAGWKDGNLPEELWLILVLLGGVGLTTVTIRRVGDWVYGLIITWLYLGILIKHVSPAGWGGVYFAAIVTLGICLVGLSMVTGYMMHKERLALRRRKFWVFR